MHDKFMHVTCQELFYTAVMLGITQLVNVEYDFPNDDAVFDAELNDVKNSLRKKKLLRESVKDGTIISFGLAACASFCEAPDSCEVVDDNGYHASVYGFGGRYMLMEHLSDDELAVGFFVKKDNLDNYIKDRMGMARGSELYARS